jgi:hypothetical protein
LCGRLASARRKLNDYLTGERGQLEMTSLQKAFVAELAVLEDIFGVDRVASRIERLNEIHRFAETTWRQYVAQIPGGVVRYLLIAEAPP